MTLQMMQLTLSHILRSLRISHMNYGGRPLLIISLACLGKQTKKAISSISRNMCCHPQKFHFRQCGSKSGREGYASRKWHYPTGGIWYTKIVMQALWRIQTLDFIVPMARSWLDDAVEWSHMRTIRPSVVVVFQYMSKKETPNSNQCPRSTSKMHQRAGCTQHRVVTRRHERKGSLLLYKPF